MNEKVKEPKRKTCNDTGQIGEEEFYQGRSVGWKECPACAEKPTVLIAVAMLMDARSKARVLDGKIKHLQAELEKHRKTWMVCSKEFPVY